MILILFLALMLFGTLCLLLRAFVVVQLWGWFITPVFPSAPHLTVLMTYGLLFTLGVILYRNGTTNEKGDTAGEKFFNTVFDSVLFSLLSWGVGATIHFFFPL